MLLSNKFNGVYTFTVVCTETLSEIVDVNVCTKELYKIYCTKHYYNLLYIFEL